MEKTADATGVGVGCRVQQSTQCSWASRESPCLCCVVRPPSVCALCAPQTWRQAGTRSSATDARLAPPPPGTASLQPSIWRNILVLVC
eukprot:scaffold11416_cov119-Isochrysis_galbana.AAC.14